MLIFFRYYPEEDMTELKESRTERNLKDTFAGEFIAKNQYAYFSSKAKKDGFLQINRNFEEIADNEKEHAKIWFKSLTDGSISDTAQNLEAAVGCENYG
jgi:rubrerythrin